MGERTAGVDYEQKLVPMIPTGVVKKAGALSVYLSKEEPLLRYLGRYIAQWYHLFAICINGLAWRWTQNLTYYDRFIANQRRALEKTGPGEWWRSTRSVRLAEAYWQRYSISHDPKDIDNAINILHDPMLLDPELHASTRSWRGLVIFRLMLQIVHRLTPRQFRTVIKFFRYQLTLLIPRRIRTVLNSFWYRQDSDINEEVVSRLIFLSGMHGARFNINGSATALDDKIICYRRAIMFLEYRYHRKFFHLWKLMAVDLLTRWRIRSDPDDLNEALAASQRALDIARAILDPTLEAQALTTYGDCLAAPKEWATPQEIADIVAIRRLALDRLPSHHHERPLFTVYLGGTLTDLGTVEFWRDETFTFPAAMNEALLCYEDALASLEIPHLNLSLDDAKIMREYILLGLVRYYTNRHRITSLLHKHSDDALKALSILDNLESDRIENALVPQRQRRSIKLARIRALKQLAERFNASDTEREKVIDGYRNIASDPQLLAGDRLTVANHWLYFASSYRHPSAQEAAEVSMELSAHVVGLGINATEQILHLNPSIRNETIHRSLDMGLRRRENLTQAERDIHFTLIESGLSLFWSARSKTTHSFDKVAVYDPDLKAELDDTILFLNGHSDLSLRDSSNFTDVHIEEQRASVHKAREKFENLLDRARRIKGLENFLKPRPFPELCRAADEGYIIVLSAAPGTYINSLTDVFALKPHHSSVQHIELQSSVGFDSYGLDSAIVRSLCEDWARLSRINVKLSSREARHGRRLVDLKVDEDVVFKDFLQRLWTLIVNPILEALGLKKRREDGTLPRVWWLPTGLVASLPFHAAGIYGKDFEECAFDYVVSSYIYSINALMDAREAYKSQTPVNQRFLAVAVPNAPGNQMLPNAVIEAKIIKNHISDPSSIVILEGSNASKESVVSQIHQAQWLHFACHALQEDTSVLGSHFVLSDGKLTLEEIMKFNLKEAEFAMLSACQTCRGDGTLTDDALHLAGGLIAAGFKSVIATRYSMQDADGPEMAKMVYRRLLRNEKWDVEGSARALHDALQNMRHRVSFRRWLPYVHFGI